MTIVKTSMDRRSFLKTTALAGGGLMIGFSWMASAKSPMGETLAEALPLADVELNGFIKIAENGVITLMAPNPEFGQNIKTSLPMLVAEDLDANWKDVVVEQAPHNAIYGRQFTGGSNGVRSMWRMCRTAGATGRRMLIEAAAKEWNVSAAEITTEASVLSHKASGKSATYGAMASKAAAIPAPADVPLKAKKDFKIIGTARKNVDGLKIVTGKPLFGMDTKVEGMLIAMITHAPGFGMKIKSVDSSAAKAMPGIKDVFTLDAYNQGYRPSMFDTAAFTDLVVVVGNSTWEVMNAKKALKIEWETKPGVTLENTPDHLAKMMEMSKTQPPSARRKNGDPETAFKNAAKVIERTYTGPFLAHNTMEPMNFFANVTADKAELSGPLQAPGLIEPTVAARIGLPADKIDFQMTRMGGGFGRRAYSHYAVEAAAISQKMNAPIKLVYTREDDMTCGIYRPQYTATYRAALDANNNLIGFHVRGGGIPESAVSPDRFPAGAVDNYLAESWTIPSNITVGAFRAPGSNFICSAEQSFLDEVAEAAGKDPIEFRLELLERARTNPVVATGQRNDYVAERYAGVLKLVKEKSNWSTPKPGVFRGVAAYFCHASYVAQVMEITMKDNFPVIEKVYCATDCGIVVNPDHARNMGEGGIIDGIGNALFGEMTFKDGVPAKNNFNTYRMIRYKEVPKSIEVHFVESDAEPTGLGEPFFPPTFAALANAMHNATGKRFYTQPFTKELETIPMPGNVDRQR
ncbi:MAG TPA: molybdopterin cofactor-binding domain-containing protein [Cyclobacteriaceae bacterium]|jgi:isoquinoline 1-oxidoreductase beta subunit|nr:molybdopterin cofactor-binding domain-containing protein [Cyclobacteriaceae bacterium]